MTSLNSKLQLALINRKKGKNLLQKGFTLVELMIVIVIVGVLSAVALPNFLGTRDKAEIGALTGSMAGLAKQCSANAILGSTDAIPGTDDGTAEPITLTAAGTGTNCSEGATLANTTAFTAGDAEGLQCLTAKGGALSTICTITVADDGAVTGAWNA